MFNIQGRKIIFGNNTLSVAHKNRWGQRGRPRWSSRSSITNPPRCKRSGVLEYIHGSALHFEMQFDVVAFVRKWASAKLFVFVYK